MKKAHQVRLIVLITAAVCLLVSTAFAQQSGKKEHTFRGKVEKVDADKKTLTVNGENVDGWMGAMTMDYKVDDPAVLKKVKVGDQITSTVYENDYTLHKVQVVPKDVKKK